MAAPVNSVLPVITGTAAVGETLSLSEGTWTGTPISYAYEWLRSGAAIVGATSETYVVTTADIALPLAGRVTATNGDGSTAATSAATDAVPSTLVVETGDGVTGADSYGTLAQLAAHHVKFGNTAWAALSAYDQEVAARKAASYITQNYSSSWKGVRMLTTQGLDWPRANVYAEPALSESLPAYPYLVADDIVPNEVFVAFADLALRAATSDLNPDLGKDVISQTVGPITTVYNASSPQSPRYRAVDMTLRPYLQSQSRVNAGVVRS